MLNITLFGPPGSGKGTQAKLLERRFHLDHVSTGDLLRAEIQSRSPLGKEVDKTIGRGDLVANEIVADLIRAHFARHAKKGAGILYDGYPRNLAQMKQLDKIMEEMDKELKLGLCLEIVEERLINRLSSRRICEKCQTSYNLISNPPRQAKVCDQCGGQLVQRRDDERAVIIHRLKEYHRQTGPVLEYLDEREKLAKVNGDRPIEAVHEDLAVLIEKIRDNGHGT